MKPNGIRSGRAVYAMLGLLGFVVAVGCEHPTSETTDYRVEHRISAEERVFSLALNLSDSGKKFDSRDEQNMRRLAQEYLRRGRGPFLVTAPDGDEAAASRIFDRVAAVLVEEGVPGDQVYLQVRRGAKTASNVTRLSFSGFYVRVPECGDWSGETGFAPSNQPHSDFGCSYQRNIGLMLANPGDLNVSRGDIQFDGVRTDYVVRVYRDGSKTIGRGKPALETGDFSDVK